MTFKRLYIATPVVCQNGHRATWRMEVDGFDVRNIGIGLTEDCPCPKHNIGQGWRASGPAEPESRRVLAHCWYRPDRGVAIKMGNWRGGDVGAANREREESWLVAHGYQVQRAYE